MHCYIHIPFCLKKCSYCDFLSFPLSSCQKEAMELYTRRLSSEIESYHFSSPIETLFFGGGTPSLLGEDQLGRIMELLEKKAGFVGGAEVSLEANPETVEKKKLMAYKALGVNRLSVGVQSLRDDVLRRIGRVHDAKRARKALHDGLEVFENINCDLMFSLPGQKKEEFLKDLEELSSLGLSHMSLYSLILEEGTPLYDSFLQRAATPDEEMDRVFYHEARELLQSKGYLHYEISNFAKPSFTCRHNENTWRMGEYKGFGIGAASFMGGVRTRAKTSLEEYLMSLGPFGHEEEYRPNKKELFEDSVMLALRTKRGVRFEETKALTGVDMKKTFASELKTLYAQGLICGDEDGFRLTPKGLDVANEVILRFWQ